MATPGDVLGLVKAGGYEFVDLRFCDLPGQVQHFTLPASGLSEESFDEGFGFMGKTGEIGVRRVFFLSSRECLDAVPPQVFGHLRPAR